jgi:glycosyltransferase involved in cell wall biosynthesis
MRDIDLSVVITTYNEDSYLDSLLHDLEKQHISGISIEIIIIEAGTYSQERAENNFLEKKFPLLFYNKPKISRVDALNLLFEIASGDLILRLDGRSSIDKNYIMNIYNLSKINNATNVGGVMLPIGYTDDQKNIARIMQHPLSLGGAKSRDFNYVGYVDSLYLGAFKKNALKKIEKPLFDTQHPLISEDSDLNFRIRKSGGSVFMDASIQVKYHARENIKEFFKLCKNYGVARGLFVLKHKTISAYRQLIPVLALLSSVILLIGGFYIIYLHYLLVALACTYMSLIIYSSFSIKPSSIYLLYKTIISFIGCHFYWTLGFLDSLRIYFNDKNLSLNQNKK